MAGLIIEEGNDPMFTLDRKLWLTADKETVVEDGDDNAAFLLGLEGDEITEEEAERLGLTKPSRKQAEPAENKQAAAPENKAAEPAKAKAKKAPARKRATKKR